jgi:hypothetical protein
LCIYLSILCMLVQSIIVCLEVFVNQIRATNQSDPLFWCPSNNAGFLCTSVGWVCRVFMVSMLISYTDVWALKSLHGYQYLLSYWYSQNLLIYSLSTFSNGWYLYKSIWSFVCNQEVLPIINESIYKLECWVPWSLVSFNAKWLYV